MKGTAKTVQYNRRQFITLSVYNTTSARRASSSATAETLSSSELLLRDLFSSRFLLSFRYFHAAFRGERG